jgi:CTP:molybdopterin cytidylyltransferase MocA
MDTVVPIILAAGSGRRMGRTKALLRFGPRTALSLVLEACREGGAAEPLVVLGHDADAVRTSLGASARPFVNPEFARSGPAASLQVGLDHLPAEAGAFLLFPVDYPLVSAQVVRALLDRWPPARAAGRRIVVPSYEMQRGHPVLFDRSLEAELRGLGPDEPIRRVVREHEAEVEHVVVNEPAVRMEMNTPEEYRRCLAAFRERQP